MQCYLFHTSVLLKLSTYKKVGIDAIGSGWVRERERERERERYAPHAFVACQYAPLAAMTLYVLDKENNSSLLPYEGKYIG